MMVWPQRFQAVLPVGPVHMSLSVSVLVLLSMSLAVSVETPVRQGYELERKILGAGQQRFFGLFCWPPISSLTRTGCASPFSLSGVEQVSSSSYSGTSLITLTM